MSFTRQQSKRADYQYQKSNQRGKQGKFQPPHASNSNGRPSQLQTSPPTSQSNSGNQQPGSPLHSPGLGKSIENSVQENDDTAKHMHDRMLFLLANMVGMTVQITVKNGTKYEGVFHGAIAEGELGTVLKLSRKLGGNVEGKSNPNPLITSQIIYAKDLMEINVVGVDFTTIEKAYGERDTFKTDADISGRAEIKERELHRWNPDDHNNETFGNLEESASGLEGNGNGSWDQFAVNEKLFGVRTDFDEEIYTTKLDRSAPDFKDREKKAIEKANEIQRSAVTNVHVLEERGITVDDSGLDEEDRYGAVVRNPTKYMPPALRKQQQQQQQQQQTPLTPTAQPGQQTPPAPVTTTPTPTPASKSGSKEPIKELKSMVEPKLAVVSPAATTTVGKPATPSSISQLPNMRPESAALLSKNVAGSTVDGKDSTKKSLDVQPPKRMEDMYITFRQFATMEKEKLNQKKQALAKKEKSDRLAELKKFHENFVLKVPVPPDLIPLLSKGKKGSPTQTEGENIGEKPKEAVTPTSSVPSTASSASSVDSAKRSTPEKKAEDKAAPAPAQVQETSITPQKLTSTKETMETAITPKPIPGSPQIEKPTSNSKFQFNVNVKEFKPNPSAPAFTPGGNQAQKTPAAEMSPFFGARTLKKGPLSVTEVLASPFSKGKHQNPGTIPPFWPFGTRHYRHQFMVTLPYDEDMYPPGAVAPGYPYPYPLQAQYRFAQMPQFGMPPMPMQQGAPIQYMNPGFAQSAFQQFPNIPFTTAPMQHAQAPPAVYSPQLPSQVVPPHQPYGSQGFPSPQRAPMVTPGMHQMYPYQPTPHGHVSQMMMRYPPEMMANLPPNMMIQRPIMPIDPSMMHYVPPEQPIVEIPNEPTPMQ